LVVEKRTKTPLKTLINIKKRRYPLTSSIIAAIWQMYVVFIIFSSAPGMRGAAPSPLEGPWQALGFGTPLARGAKKQKKRRAYTPHAFVMGSPLGRCTGH
jgi:hypothetical protein